ncbi:MAG: hypothetical protein HY270_15700 [Deltaproteobacteria bacterium]|nr:hypothetical protein [Deltaproteobacteria bacterium]
MSGRDESKKQHAWFKSTLLTAVVAAVTFAGVPDTLAFPPAGNVDVMVGSGNGDGGPAINALVEPRGLATCGNPPDLYIADGLDNRVRMVEGTTGDIITLAGTGKGGFSGDGGAAVDAQVNFPTDVLCDAAGNAYVADGNNNRVRFISASGIITTIAGNGSAASTGDGGPATQASLNGPRGLALDGRGSLYVAEFSGNRIRKISNGTITTVAGAGNWGSTGDGGLATLALLANPAGVAVDTSGRIFIADYNNSKVRRVDVDGTIATIAGDGFQGFIGDGGPAQASRLKLPYRVRFDTAGNLFFLDNGNNRVRRLQAVNGVVGASSTITTVAGNGSNGSTGDGGPASNATFWYLNGLAIDSANKIYLGLTVNTVPSTDNRVRVIDTNGIISTEVGSGEGDGGPAINALIDPRGITTGSGTGALDLYVADGNNNRVRLVDGDTQIITTIAGTGVGCPTATSTCGYGGLAINAQLRSPFGVAHDANGNVYIADTVDNRIRKVNASGIITTIAGSGSYGLSGDGGDATRGALALPYSVACDDSGSTLYVADFANNRVRKIAAGIITTFAGTTFGNAGDGGPAASAKLANPADAVIGPDGMIYIADFSNNAVRRARADGSLIERVVGNGTACNTPTLPCGDGGQALSAQLNQPSRLAFDSAGRLYIGDSQTKRVRQVDLNTGIITTIAGTGNAGTEGDGGPALAANFYRATGLTVDSFNHVYIAQSDASRVRVVSMSSSAQATSTPTRTPTPTLAPTATSTWTPTAIPTFTLPPTPTRTATFTWTGTPTSTPTTTATASRTPTNTPTLTSTSTSTSTQTPTLTLTLTPTLTATRTWTPTPTWTFTLPATPTSTWTLTATATATPSFSPTVTATYTFTVPPTATPTSLGGNPLFGGAVSYFSNAQPVSGTTVILESPDLGAAGPQTTSDTTGQYMCPELTQELWTAMPSKTGGTGNSITALDATKVLQAAVGMTSLSPEQRLACDVNGSGTISAIDATLILQYRVGLISALPITRRCNSDWLFIPTQSDPGPNQIISAPVIDSTTCQQGTIAFQPLVESAVNQNFEGVVFGDCNGNWTPTTGGGASTIVADVRVGRPRSHGTHVQIPIVVGSDRAFSSLELRVRYDANELSVPEVHRSHGAHHAVLQANTNVPGELRIALASTSTMSPGQVLNLHFESRTARGRAPRIHILHAGVE